MRRLISVTLLLLALTAAMAATAEEGGESPEAFVQRLAQAHNSADAAAIAAMYAEDAREIIGPGTLSGRDNIRMQYQVFYGSFAEDDLEFEFRMTVEESWIDGDTAMVWGDLAVDIDGMDELPTSRFILRLERDEGGWKIVRSWQGR